MPRAFLQTAAPSGQAWEAELRGVSPSYDNQGCVGGKWGECMHWAVVFERQNPNWDSMPQYANQDGPAGQVIDYFKECGHGDGEGLEKNEELTNQALDRGDENFVFQQTEAVQAQVVQPAFGAAAVPAYGAPYQPAAAAAPAYGAPYQAQAQPVGQPYQATVVGQGVPHHPGAPGTQVVVGIPWVQQANSAINQGGFDSKKNDTVVSGASILDDNPAFPDNRPMRDCAFGLCFFVVCILIVALFAWLVPEIPKMVTRLSTHWEVTANTGCGLFPMTKWPNGESIVTDGLNQRLTDGGSNSSRRLSEREGLLGHSCVGCDAIAKAVSHAAPEFELPGLSAYVGRVETIASLVGMNANLQPNDDMLHDDSEAVRQQGRRLYGNTGYRRRRTQTANQKPADTDCERACAAFPECLAFDVIKTSKATECKYQSAGSASATAVTAGTTIACFKKIDTADIDSVAGGIVGRLFGLTIVGAIVSMIVAFGFVKFASVQPSTATYCGVYFVPGCMIVLGFIIMGALVTFIGSVAIIFGLILVCCGGCLCACTWFCYRDLIPLTIQVVEAVTQVILKYWSMLFISAASGVMSIMWSFLCSGVFVGFWARTNRLSATTPAGGTNVSGTASQVGYIQYFFECLIYFWGGFVAFNLSHVTFCGVFGRWYYGKEDSKTLSSSAKVAFGTSFGSICLGSLIIAVVRAMEAVARKMMNDAEESGNYVACVIACIISAIIGCIGDILEWISLYAYVQVAVRGLNFLGATKATYSMATISNLIYVVSAILVEWVVGMGAAFCGLSGAVVAGVVGYLASQSIPEFAVILAVIGAIFGLLAGCVAGGSAVGVMNSGSVTILMSWAENPDILKGTHPELHQKFTEVIYDKRMEATQGQH